MSDATTSQEPDDAEPSPERQAVLRAAHDANMALGRPPYAGVDIRTRGEVSWIMREHGWSGEYDTGTLDEAAALNDMRPGHQRGPLLQAEVADRDDARVEDAPVERADLREAILASANLGDIRLRRANLSGANLLNARLEGASLTDASLCEARLRFAILRGASLRYTDLSRAYLRGADLAGADLTYAKLTGARLLGTKLPQANLRGASMDPTTVLVNVIFDSQTRLVDVIWNGVSLAQIDWGHLPRLGDGQPLPRAWAPEEVMSQATRRSKRLYMHQTAARAYRGLAKTLQAQGLVAAAVYFRACEQRHVRRTLRLDFKLGQWLFSCLLNLVSGYGDKPGRALGCYVGVVGAFAAAYFALTNGLLGFVQSQSAHLKWYEALVLSISSFHGRGFFPSVPSLGDPVAIVAAAEAIIGLFIELVFIATFTQRFFAR
jgi:hypothetical protein